MRKTLLAAVLLTMLGAQGCATNVENLLLGGLVGATLLSSAGTCSRSCY